MFFFILKLQLFPSWFLRKSDVVNRTLPSLHGLVKPLATVYSDGTNV